MNRILSRRRIIILAALVLVMISRLAGAQESDYLLEDGIPDEIISGPAFSLPPDVPDTDEDKEKQKVEKKEHTKSGQNPARVESKKNGERKSAEPIYDPSIPPADVNENPDPDNPLSFNFLYYIIQKFKFADVVDN